MESAANAAALQVSAAAAQKVLKASNFMDVSLAGGEKGRAVRASSRTRQIASVEDPHVVPLIGKPHRAARLDVCESRMSERNLHEALARVRHTAVKSHVIAKVDEPDLVGRHRRFV